MRPVCVKCKQLMEKDAIGVQVALVVPSVSTERPYEIWSGDGWSCRGCGTQIVCQWGNGPFWHHFHKGEVPRADVTVVSE